MADYNESPFGSLIAVSWPATASLQVSITNHGIDGTLVLGKPDALGDYPTRIDDRSLPLDNNHDPGDSNYSNGGWGVRISGAATTTKKRFRGDDSNAELDLSFITPDTSFPVTWYDYDTEAAIVIDATVTHGARRVCSLYNDGSSVVAELFGEYYFDGDVQESPNGSTVASQLSPMFSIGAGSSGETVSLF